MARVGVDSSPFYGAHALCQSHQPPATGPMPSQVPCLLDRGPQALPRYSQTVLEGAKVLRCDTSKERPSDLVTSERGPGLSLRRRLCSWTSKDRLDFQAGGQERERPGPQERLAGSRLEGWGFRSQESTGGREKGHLVPAAPGRWAPAAEFPGGEEKCFVMLGSGALRISGGGMMSLVPYRSFLFLLKSF